MSRYVCTDDCVVVGHSCCGPHESCIDEHMDYSCDRIPDFLMEVVSKERRAETLIIVGLVFVSLATASTRWGCAKDCAESPCVEVAGEWPSVRGQGM